jgi:uncharacterized protein YbaA (DUF1428 family)
MPLYVDGFLVPVPTKKLPEYKRMATLGRKVWMRHGALAYVEAVAEDPTPGFGLPFPKLCKCKKGETVVFAYIVYKSRAHRDRVCKKVMTDPDMAKFGPDSPMPFDPKRMAWGGFKALVQAGSL